jgi:hypothetical protein
MFSAMILICAGSIHTPDTCFMQVYDDLFNTYDECRSVIVNSVRDNPDLFSFFDEELNMMWKPVDWECLNWKRLKT